MRAGGVNSDDFSSNRSFLEKKKYKRFLHSAERGRATPPAPEKMRIIRNWLLLNECFIFIFKKVLGNDGEAQAQSGFHTLWMGVDMIVAFS